MIPIGLIILVPFLTAVGMIVSRNKQSFSHLWLVFAGVVNLLLLCLIFVARNDYGVEVLFETLPGLRIAFHVEPLGLIFALTAATLWPITSVYAIGYLSATKDQHQTRFHGLFCIAIGSAMGIAFAENLFTLFLFYEILTFSTWPLVTHSRTESAVRAGRIYLGVLLTSSLMFFLLAIILAGNEGDGLSFVKGGVLSHASPFLSAVLLVLFLFGIGKAAVMPFHRWLPNAMVAPAPVSALLHAVAVVKAGVFSILKISVYIFGFDTLASIEIRDVLIWVPAVTILLGSAIAMRQDDLKARLAYSTISQLSYIILGALMANQFALIGSGLHIPMHAFGKITLFFCAGSIMVFTGKKYVSELDGMGRSMPWTFTAFFLATLSIAGLPPGGGLWSKGYLALGALQMDQIALLVVLMVSSLLNVYYLLSIPFRAFFLAPVEPVVVLENRMSMTVPLVVTALVSLLLFFVADDLVNFLGDFANRISAS